MPAATEAVAAAGLSVKGRNPLGPAAVDLIVESADLDALRADALAAVEGLPVDVCAQDPANRRKKLFLADMDSTIINVECLDELADFAGLKAEIAAITERARDRVDHEYDILPLVAVVFGDCGSEESRSNTE